MTMRVKRMKVVEGRRLNIGQFPNFHRSGSIRGMKKLYYGENCLLVRCGNSLEYQSANDDCGRFKANTLKRQTSTIASSFP